MHLQYRFIAPDYITITETNSYQFQLGSTKTLD